MQTQYIYPSGDNPSIGPVGFQGLTDFSKSTASSSGYYTYLDEGITTYNDNDYIYISGMYHASGYDNPAGRNYLTFDMDRLQVRPSSVSLNVRCLYMPDDESGTVNMVAYLCNSGRFYTSTSISGINFWTGLNQQCIVASSIFTVTSGATFTNHTANMILNSGGINSVDKYHDCTLALGYLYSPAHGLAQTGQHGTLKISAVEAILSGEYISNKYLPMQICGGSRLSVRTDKLLIYHDYSNQGVGGNNGVFQVLNPDDEVASITYEYAHDLLNKQSPVMCLNSGSIQRSDIFNDCFFNFSQKPTTSNNIDFASIKSSHKFNLYSNIQIPASSNWYAGRSYSPTGNEVSAANHYVNKDSFIIFEPYLGGIASGCFPSGDFAMWIGASQLPVTPNSNIEFIESIDGDFSFGINSNNKLYANLLSISGTYNTVTGTAYNNIGLGVVVTYDSGGLGLYKMDTDGNIIYLNQTEPFTRRVPASPSGDLRFSLPTTFNNAINLNLTLYEFGIINSGMNNSNITLLNRSNLFDSLSQNILNGSIASGSHHITYKSLQDRGNYSGYLYSGDFFNFGRYQVGADDYGFLIPSEYDADMRDIATPNKYGVPYVDISENCFLSGTTDLFFQDGSLYFSGWIDASTTNPSGFLPNNFFVRALQDKSVFYDIPNDFYDFGNPGTPASSVSVAYSSIYTAYEHGSYLNWTDSLGGITNLRNDLLSYDAVEMVGDINGDNNNYVFIRMSGIPTASLSSSGDVTITLFKEHQGAGTNNKFLLCQVYKSDQTTAISTETYTSGNGWRYLPVTPLSTNVADWTNPYIRVISSGSSSNESLLDYLTLGMSGTSTVEFPAIAPDGVYSGRYTNLTEARGKVAAGTTSLRSGLNEYIFPLEKALYRFDLYTDVNGVVYPNAVNYDKSTIEHTTWDGGDVSLYYAGRNDVLSSGYTDTLKIYTAAIITESWSDPLPTMSGITDLYTYGIGVSNSGVDLFACSSFSMSGLDLSLRSAGYTSGITTLFIEGSIAKSGMNLMIGNYQSGTNSYIPLYTIANPYPSSTNLANLYINSTTYSSIINSFDMVIQNSGYGVITPLFLKVDDGDENSDQITLVVYNDTTATKGIDFYLSQNNSSIFASQKLFVRGNGLNDGGLTAQSGHTLVIGAGPDPYYNILPMTINGPSGTNNIVYISMSGGTYVNNSMNLVIGSSTGYLNNSTNLYTHGF